MKKFCLILSISLSCRFSIQNCNLKKADDTFFILDLANSPSQYKISGSITGISGSVTLQLNGSESLTLSANGAFEFATSLATGDSYSVTVSSQPTGLTCSVANGSGSVASAKISDIVVSCVSGKKIFVTAAAFNGDLVGGAGNGILGADAKCQADANKPLDGATYKAIIVDGTNRRACTSNNCGSFGSAEHRDWVLAANTSYIRASDSASLFTTNSNSIFIFGTLDASFSSAATVETWTGFSAALRWSEELIPNKDCNDWTDPDSGLEGRVGRSNLSNYNALRIGSGNACNLMQNLICVQQ